MTHRVLSKKWPVFQRLYRGVSPDDPTKICAVMQAKPGVMAQFMDDHKDMIAASGHVLESTVHQVFVDA
jgi:hypothetical protein